MLSIYQCVIIAHGYPSLHPQDPAQEILFIFTTALCRYKPFCSHHESMKVYFMYFYYLTLLLILIYSVT